MGTYLNPGNSGFEEIVKSDYVDKTGLIGLIKSYNRNKAKAYLYQLAAQIWKILCRPNAVCVL